MSLWIRESLWLALNSAYNLLFDYLRVSIPFTLFQSLLAELVLGIAMSRVFGLFGGSKIQHSGSSTSLSDLDPVAALQQTLDGLNALLDDDLNGSSHCLTAAK